MILYDDFLSQFQKLLSSDPVISQYWEKAKRGESDFQDARAYANNVLMKWNSAMYESIGTLPINGSDVSKEEWQSIRDSIEKLYNETAAYARDVVKTATKNAGFNINAIGPKIDEERFEHLYTRVQTITDEMPSAVVSDVVTSNVADAISKAAISDTIKANARLQSNAGIRAYITRDAGAGCCDWCTSMAGTYEYGNMPQDFWRVHAGCTCTFIYRPSRTERIVTRFNTRYETDKDGNKKAIITKITE